jgi:hypothetical protein
MTRRPRRALRALLTSILVVTGIGVAAGAPAQAAPPARLDLVLLLDGSGSIDDDDWKLQLDGYAEALRDRTNFPLDGSVAVSLIQWSRGGSSRPSTRVEVPLTVLDSEATVEQVRQAVLDISQMGHDTNPGDAIAAGTDELALHGRAGANRSLCMSTDGIINSGRTMVDAVAYAKTGGVDRYSVIAIEDGSFTEARARSSYGPYVFGGGQVTVARTTAEFTTMITGCVAEPLQLVALEVTQGLQDLDNTVSLVETRDTLVRAYLATTDDSLRRATARLHVTRNGTPIPGSPFTPTNAEAPVDGNALGDRGNLGATLNYRIPAAEAHGTWDLRLEYGGGLTCTRQAQNPTCGEQVTFRQGMDMDLEMVGVTWGPPINREVAEGVAWAAGVVRGAPELMEQAERIRSQLPVSSLDVRWRVLAVSIPPVGGATFLGLLARMDILRAFENRPVWGPGDTVSVTHAVVPGKNPRGKGHIAGLSRGLVSAAYDADASKLPA